MGMDQAQLVAALKKCEPEAINELVSASAQRLTRSAYLLCGNEADAQDLVQDTFVEALKSVHRFEGRSSLHTWLHVILLNLTRHYWRKRQRLVFDNEVADQQLSGTEEAPSPVDAEH